MVNLEPRTISLLDICRRLFYAPTDIKSRSEMVLGSRLLYGDTLFKKFPAFES